MAAGKFLRRVSGKTKEVSGVTTATADAIPALDATGRISSAQMPVGVGAEITQCASFENLTAGDFVNLFLDSAVIKARKADATDASKQADGFVMANVTAPATADVYRLSQTNTALAGMTIGSEYYLSTTPGAVVVAPGPVAAGNLNQRLGKASSATELVFDGDPSAAVEMA